MSDDSIFLQPEMPERDPRDRERSEAYESSAPAVPAPAKSSFSPKWLLALLPLGIGIGWLVGQIPVDAAAPEPVRVTVTRPASSSPDAPVEIRSEAPAAGNAESAPAERDKEPVAQSSPWMSYESALAESDRTGKPILLDFNAEWCPPCQRLKSEVFDSGMHGPAVQLAVIPVSIVDRQRESGSNSHETESLQRRYGVEAFPTLVVFHPRTGRVQQTKGFGGAERTVQWVQWAAASVK